MKQFTEKGGWYWVLAIALAITVGFLIRADSGWDFEAYRAKNLDGLVKETREARATREERIGAEVREVLKSFYAVEYNAHCRDVPDRGRQLELCRNGAHARAGEDAAKEWRNILKRIER